MTDFPTEEEQFEAYKEVAMALEGKPVTIWTMDIEEINLFLIWSFQKKKILF